MKVIESPKLVVETASGKVKGTFGDGISIFRGIPFAASPVGALRFQSPAPVIPWTGVKDCIEFGPISWQNAPGVRIGCDPFFAPGVSQSEDCLSLNVWTPGVDGELRAVIVYFHGGGFNLGSGTAPWFEGSILASSENIVVVTVNYRLGFLGSLLVSDELTAANNLLRDQVAALDWVQENIASFGGDPGRVTIAGESAGAMSVVALLAVPSASGKFRSLIVESGHGSFIPPIEYTREIQRRAYIDLGISDSDDPFTALQLITPSRLLKTQGELGAEFLMPSRPQVDGSLLPIPIIEAVAMRDGVPLPMLIGNAAEEARAFSDRSADIDFSALVEALTCADRSDSSVAEIIDIYREAGNTDADSWDALRTDLDWLRPSRRLIGAHASAGSPVYQFEFAWRTPAFGLGASHAVIVPFPFGNVRNLGGTELFDFDANGEVSGRSLSDNMVRAWGSFVRDGKPSCEELPEWPKVDLKRPVKMRLNIESELIPDDFVERDDIWAKNFPKVPSRHESIGAI